MEVRGISASELSRRLGVGRSTVSQWISGKYNVTTDKIYLIGKALDIDPAWFVSNDYRMRTFSESRDQVSLEETTISKFYKLTDENKRIVRGFIDGLLYKQDNK